MRLLQNLLKIVIRACFQKFILELETFSNIKAVDFTLENVQYFILLISCLYTLNLLSLLMNWVTTFDKATYRTMESRESCKTTYMIRIKESDERSIFKKFWTEYCYTRSIPGKWNCDGNWGMKTKSSRRPCQKLYESFIKCDRDINCTLKKLYYMNLKFDYRYWI